MIAAALQAGLSPARIRAAFDSTMALHEAADCGLDPGIGLVLPGYMVTTILAGAGKETSAAVAIRSQL